MEKIRGEFRVFDLGISELEVLILVFLVEWMVKGEWVAENFIVS